MMVPSWAKLSLIRVLGHTCKRLGLNKELVSQLEGLSCLMQLRESGDQTDEKVDDEGQEATLDYSPRKSGVKNEETLRRTATSERGIPSPIVLQTPAVAIQPCQ